MSHTTKIDSVQITDVAAIVLAVRDLNAAGVVCSLVENETPRAYYSRQAGMGKANYVLRLAQCDYDVGLYKTDSGYEARTDLYMDKVAKVLGAKAKDGERAEQAAIGKFLQAYAVNATIRQAATKGYKVSKTVKSDGTVQLTLNV